MKILCGLLLSVVALVALSGCGGSSSSGSSGVGGSPGTAVLSATSLTFAGTTVGTTSAAQTVTVSNTGGLPLTFLGVSIAGTNPTAFTATTNCMAFVSAGASCTVSVTFTPGSAATFSASLALTDSGAGNPQMIALSGTGTVVPSTVSTIYVIQQGTPIQSVLQFPVTASGAATPAATLTPAGMQYVDAVATDASGQIYVGGTTPAGVGEVLVFAAGASGSPTPLRTITGGLASSTNTFAVPLSLVVGANGVLYVLSTGSSYYYGSSYSVAAFPSTASGTATPMSFLTGTATGLTNPLGIAADAAGNLYVSNAVSTATTATGQIEVFASGATGNTAPIRTITNSNVFYGVAVDASMNIYATLDYATTTSPGSIVEFTAGATGAATPVRTISGTTTTYYFGGGIRVDSAGYVYVVNVVNPAAATPVQSVLSFGPTASGNVAPTVNFTSTAWSSGGSEIAIK